MSPRLEDFPAQPRDRAALSEHEEYARRHGGTWNLFFQRYVAGAAEFIDAVEAMLAG